MICFSWPHIDSVYCIRFVKRAHDPVFASEIKLRPEDSNFLGRKDNYCTLFTMYIINKDMSLLIFKALNNLAPNYILCSKINMARNSHSHNTRGAAKNHL